MNQSLIVEIRSWKKKGSVPQSGSDWRKFENNWLNGFPNHADHILNLPDLLNRDNLRELCSLSDCDFELKFLSVMIWGYGHLGYGAHRVKKMFNCEDFEKSLASGSARAVEGQPELAYRNFMENRISGLGPSYASKYISFLTPRSVSAPIFDSLILRWIRKHAASDFVGFKINKVDWDVDTYSRYCEWINTYAVSEGCFPDEIELCIFNMAEREFLTNNAS